MKNIMKLPETSRWLRIGRATVFGYAVLLIVISVAGTILFPAYASLHAAEFYPNGSWEPDPKQADPLLADPTQAGLAQLGWPATVPAYIDLGRALLLLVAGSGVALLLLWRRPASGFILYLAFTLVSISGKESLYKPLFAAIPILQAYAGFTGANGWQFYFILFFFFPDGRAVPGWTRWAALCWLGLIVLQQFLPNAFFQAPVVQAFFFFLVFSALGSQFYRYFRRSTPLQRQQTKWIAVLLLLFLVEGIGLMPWAFKAPAGPDLRGELVFALVKLGLDNLLLALVPVAIFLAIIRYRLWDIDLVIRRTLSYGIITALLALIYLGAVTLSQQLLTALTGQDSPAAVVLSTLLIVVLFTPLRRRVQGFIDRRFFRQKYNAEQAVASFSAAARSQVELDALAGQLVAAAQESLQPESVSIWIRK